MFEKYTKEEILEEILQGVPDDEDTQPRSPLYIMAAPSAKEFEKFYKDFDFVLEQFSPVTSDREYLINFAKVFGLIPYEASKTTVEGEFDILVNVGQRFTRDNLVFKTVKYLQKRDNYYYYELECETPGEIGNVAIGQIIPISPVENLKHAVITKILKPGEETEETEDFRERFLNSFNNKRFCGNLADYFSELLDKPGIGKAKVLRCRNYKGEIEPEWVTVVFTDSEGHKPSEELVKELQEYFQPLGEDNLPTIETSGTGLSPVGQLCWVEGVKETTVNFGLKLSFKDGYNFDNLKPTIEEKIKERLNQYVLEDWGDTKASSQAFKPYENKIVVRRSIIEAVLIDIDGISDSSDMKINDKFENLTLDWDSIPVLGEIVEHDETEIVPGEGNCPYNCPDCGCNQDGSKCPKLTS